MNEQTFMKLMHIEEYAERKPERLVYEPGRHLVIAHRGLYAAHLYQRQRLAFPVF